MKKVTLILISLLLCLCLVGCDDDHDDVVDNDVDDVVEVKNTITPLEDKKITGYTSYDIFPYNNKKHIQKNFFCHNYVHHPKARLSIN